MDSKYIKKWLFPEELTPGDQCYISGHNIHVNKDGNVFIDKDSACYEYKPISEYGRFYRASHLLSYEGSVYNLLLTVPSGWKIGRELLDLEKKYIPIHHTLVVERGDMDMDMDDLL